MNRLQFRNFIFRKNTRPFGVIIIFLFTVIFAPIDPARAQTIEIGLFGGDSYYLGDLNPGVHFQHPQIAFGVLTRYNLDTRWSVKLSGYYGKVTGSSSTSTFLPDNQLSFTSPITDISATVEFNFLDYFTGSRRDVASPYIYSGIGFFFFNPQSGGVMLKSAGTEGQNDHYKGRKPYSTFGVSIPFGLGAKFSISKRLCLAVFWEMHKTFTDYIDDVSTTYYLNGDQINPNDQTAVLSDPTMNHEPGMQRGNSKTKDWYSFSGLTLTYWFSIHSSKRCRDLHHH
jgi:hypothetical protein